MFPVGLYSACFPIKFNLAIAAPGGIPQLP